MPNCVRGLPRFWLINRYLVCLPVNNNTFDEQYYLHIWVKIHEYGPRGFLLWYPHGGIWVHVNNFILNTSRNHQPIRAGLHWGKRLDIYQNSKGNAWPEAVRKNCQRPLEKASVKIWLWNNAPHPYAVETHLSRYCIHPCTGKFRVNNPTRQYAKHLRNDLKLLYPVTTGWTGSKFLGLILEWDCINRTVDLSMPNYIPEALHKFHYKAPENPQDTTHHRWELPVLRYHSIRGNYHYPFWG